ncbi:MAG: 1-acyl-sn-glycerol-3-phosphate acyltransferase [Bacteroidales bacterium]|jgi:1-acyl-sn-glycerol-3-phosphate acyltransferase|nr:1-acyl-sn-glycerol-3-phosphate acyltransferase [Bacteroidales bacterium]MCI2145451.1 1-acyl-sn-glycerol-3-phosphate acyltransferase [Bacteroidales bacterium]
MINHRFSKFLIRLLGWKGVGGLPADKKCIILGIPHTSIWDFVIAFYYYRTIGGDIHVMIKKELFKGRLGRWLLVRGSIPIDRKNSMATIRNVIKAFSTHDTLYLGIAPEGTRKPVKRWKTGFYTIAKAAKVPVYLGWFDWKTKTISAGERFELSDDSQLDLRRIQLYYRKKNPTPRHPKNFVFLDEVEEAYREGREF